MPNLICYDIQNNYLRTRIGNKILDAGFDRINLSVYLGTTDQRSLKELEKWLRETIEKKGDPDDSVIVLHVTIQQIQENEDLWQKRLGSG